MRSTDGRRCLPAYLPASQERQNSLWVVLPGSVIPFLLIGSPVRTAPTDRNKRCVSIVPSRLAGAGVDPVDTNQTTQPPNHHNNQQQQQQQTAATTTNNNNQQQQQQQPANHNNKQQQQQKERAVTTSTCDLLFFSPSLCVCFPFRPKNV